MGAKPTGVRTDKQQRGSAGEDEALAYLQERGLRLVERNFRCKTGEIDLIMADGDSLVFIEVRRRANSAFGGAAASVTSAKQQKLLRAAQFYLLRFRAVPACRFDVIAIEGGALNWIKNAISA
jgi:putative endonuclease